MKKQQLLLPLLLLTGSFIFLIQCQTPQPQVDDYPADLPVSWNEKILAMAVAEDGLLTLKGVRTAALAHLAIHDALQAIHPQYESYAYNGVEKDADPIISAAQAAYAIAVHQFPDQQSALESERDKWFAMVAESPAKTAGIELGKKAATAVLQDRNNDNWNGEAEYTWHPMGPGVYAEFNEHSGTPEGFVFGSGWAVAKPFALDKPDHFRSPPPPEINSEAYTKAFDEVKAYGRTKSDVRTADQAHLAMWWKDFVENSHNRLARQVIQAEKLNLWTANRALALLNMSVFDAYVNVFDNKFHYNHWRPYTAIRWAANDENPDTKPEADWNNLHRHTYAFPSYPSAHGAASATAMTTLANSLGLGDDYTFTMTTAEVDKAGPFSGKIAMDPPTRSFASFSEAAMECSLSRVYLGIHFRYDSEEGYRLGNQVGDYISSNFLTPVKDAEG